MSVLSPARAAALSCLMEAEEGGRYVREVLDVSSRVSALDRRDAGLARRLALGVTASQGCLDEVLDRYLDRPGKVSPRVRMALRVSSFELLYLRTAPEVAVSQGVELVRSVAKAAAGLANAVLRRVAEGAASYLSADDVSENERPLVSLARSAGLPVWLVREAEVSLRPDGACELCACELEPAPLAVHLNALRPKGVCADVEEDGILPGCARPSDDAAFIASGALERADAVVSDRGAQLVATAATRPGSCLEVGAGRGTKTFVMMSQAHRAGFDHAHLALDLSEQRCRANGERLAAAGMDGVRVFCGDGCDLDTALASLDAAAGECVLFDTVLVDAPCSGTGTMRRHPEIPWRLREEDVSSSLPALQLELLRGAASRVRPGGELFYATCSVLCWENSQVVGAFLSSGLGSDFSCEPVSTADIFGCSAFLDAGEGLRAVEHGDGSIQLVPRSGGVDGHFCARLVRHA